MDDEELLRRVKRGDSAALGDLYHRHLPALWRFVYARMADEAAPWSPRGP